MGRGKKRSFLFDFTSTGLLLQLCVRDFVAVKFLFSIGGVLGVFTGIFTDVCANGSLLCGLNKR